MMFFDEPIQCGSENANRIAEIATLRAVDDVTFSAYRFPTLSNRKITNSKGIVTTIMSSEYDDNFFILITQCENFGTLISAWADDRLDRIGKSYETCVLMGKRDDELLDVFAQQILQKITVVSTKPLLLSIALAEDGRDAETFKQILDAVCEMLV